MTSGKKEIEMKREIPQGDENSRPVRGEEMGDTLLVKKLLTVKLVLGKVVE